MFNFKRAVLDLMKHLVKQSDVIKAEFLINRYYEDRGGIIGSADDRKVHHNWQWNPLEVDMGDKEKNPLANGYKRVVRALGNDAHFICCAAGAVVNILCKGAANICHYIGGAFQKPGEMYFERIEMHGRKAGFKNDVIHYSKVTGYTLLHAIGSTLVAAGDALSQAGSIAQNAAAGVGYAARAVSQIVTDGPELRSNLAQCWSSITKSAAGACKLVTEPVKSFGESIRGYSNNLTGVTQDVVRVFGNAVVATAVVAEGFIEAGRAVVTGHPTQVVSAIRDGFVLARKNLVDMDTSNNDTYHMTYETTLKIPGKEKEVTVKATDHTVTREIGLSPEMKKEVMNILTNGNKERPIEFISNADVVKTSYNILQEKRHNEQTPSR